MTNTGSEIIFQPFTLTDDQMGIIDTSSAPDQLEANESFTVTANYQVTQGDVDQGYIKAGGAAVIGNVEIDTPVAGDTGKEEVNARSSDNDNIVIFFNALKIEKSADKNLLPKAGDTITYTYLVTNTGSRQTIYGSTDGSTPGPFILKDDKIGEISSGTVVELGANKSLELTAPYIVQQEDIDRGFVTNTVKVQASYIDYPNEPMEVTATLTISGPQSDDEYREDPAIELKKSADKKEFSEVGEIITYTYVVTNTGNTLVRGDFYGATEEPFKLEDDQIGKIDTSSQASELNPGESFTVTAQYEVSQADIDRGKVTNIAKVTAISGNNIIEDTASLTIRGKKKEKPAEPSIEDKLNIEDHFQYIAGYPDNTVRPDGPITREEVAAVFYRLLTSDYRNSIKTRKHNFKDVKAGRWSEQSVATLTSAKIIVGYEDGSFKPGNPITRAELAAIASRFDQLAPLTSNRFSDINNHWASQVINSAAEKGWVNGYEDGTFRPNKYMTRAEFVALVNNVLNRGVKKENILPKAKQFPDLLESKWYYESMQEAINSHHYTREKDTDDEIWIEIYFPEVDM